MSKVGAYSIGIVVVVACLWAATLGQGTSVSILGTVYDQSQAILPGVLVTATDKNTGQKRTAITDDQGRYIMAQMKVGNYVVQAELPGFQTATRETTLTLEGDGVINFTLTVGAAATEVTVTSEAPLVETTTSSVRSLVDHQQIRDLPLNGRSFTDLATLQTGVLVNYWGMTAQTQTGAEGIKISIAGTRVTRSSFLLDGTDIRNLRGGSPGSVAGVQLGVDTVQEFSVITSVASAEYGNFAGGVVNAVTKSGTNGFHGSLFEFHRNSALDARNFFDRDVANPLTRSNPPPFKRNQYGFTLGGPIKKDKLFFFASLERLHDRLTTTRTSVVPSLDARRGFIPNQGQFTVSPITKPILDTYPLPNGPARPDGTADRISPARYTSDETYFVSKVDWQLSEKDMFAARYLIDIGDKFSPSPTTLDVVYSDAFSRAHFIVLEWKRLFSAKLINEARVSMNRTYNGNEAVEQTPLPPAMHFNPFMFRPTGRPSFGQLSVPSIDTLGFFDSQLQTYVQNRFQYIDNLSYASGAHSFKVGFNIHRIQLNVYSPLSMGGTYSFVSLKDLITGATPRRYSGGVTGYMPRGMRQVLMGFYAQDDWRIRPNFTLNAGVRYEPITLPVEVAGRLSNLSFPSDSAVTLGNPWVKVNTSLRNFAPRLGMAWDLFGDGKTSIRAGYGVFYELFAPLFYFNAVNGNTPFELLITRDRPPFPNPVADLGGDFSRFPVSVRTMSDEIKQGGVHQFNLSLQHELLSGLVGELTYTGSRGYNLVRKVERNAAIAQRDGEGRYPFFPANAVRRNPSFQGISDLMWDGDSLYNALGMTVRKRFSQGYSFQLSYTFGKFIDDATTHVGGEDYGASGQNALFPDDPHFNRSLSTLNIRNRLSVNGSWILPFGSGQAVGSNWSGITEKVLGGWTLNGILTASDGTWMTVVIPSLDWSRSRERGTERPSLIPGGNQNPVLSGGRDPNKYFDTTQFVLGPQGYYGTLGRNTLNRPGVLTVDFSIQKNFNFTEEKYFQIKAEMFNVANRANFDSPNTQVILDEAGRRDLTAGRITATVTTSRQIQFAAKFYF
ncbi:MAG: TonB-dependent receptor [Acidobacteria bacterium]|nr:TonB-dependent receptor [Acidobacteriota bacterium]